MEKDYNTLSGLNFDPEDGLSIVDRELEFDPDTGELEGILEIPNQIKRKLIEILG